MLSLVHVAVLLLPMVVGHLPSPVTQIGAENILRSLSDDITYRNYQPGDDLRLIGRQAVEFCKDNVCYVAVDRKSIGQKTVVGIVQMIIPGKHLSPQDRNAICGDRPSTSRPSLCCVFACKRAPKGNLGHLYFLKVSDAYRGRGIATEMLSHTFAVVSLSSPLLNSFVASRLDEDVDSVQLYECSCMTIFLQLGQTHPKLMAIYLHVDSDNLPAIRLYEKSGFKRIASPSSKVFLYARYM